MTDHKWTLPSTDFPEQDHDAFLALCDGNMNRVTVYGYARTWSMFLAAVNTVVHGFLQLGLEQRLTAENVEIFTRSLMLHLNPIDVIATLRAFKTCVTHLFGARPEYIDPIIVRIQIEAKENGELKRPGLPQKGISSCDVSENDLIPMSKLRDAKDEDGKKLNASTIKSYEQNVRLYLGILDRRGLNWKSMTPDELLSKENVSLVTHEWCSAEEPWKMAQRLNALGCAFQHLFGSSSVSTIFSAAAKLRTLNPDGNSSKSRHKYVSLDRVSDEDRKRLEFSLKKNWNRPFTYEGKDYILKYRPSREATAEKCRSTLRAMTTILEISAPDMLLQPTEERDYKKIISMFAIYYADCPLSSQVAALDGLRSLLRRILPISTDLRFLRRKIRNLKRQIVSEDLVVHDIHPDEILDFAVGVMEQSYRRFTALQRCKAPYCNPMEYALRYRAALQIGLLAHNPLRLRSLQLLDINEFDRVSLGSEVRYFVRVPKEKMKMGVKHDFLLESVLTPWIDRYLGEVRNVFLSELSRVDEDAVAVNRKAGEEKAMWISKREKRMSKTALSLAIPTMMSELCGFRINIQLFRRFVATAEIGTQNGSKRLAQRNRMSRKAYEDTKKSQNVDRTTSLKPLFGEMLRPEKC